MNTLTAELIKANLQAQIDGKRILPLNISGDRGLGKTATIQAITKELNSELLLVNIGSKNLEFFSGIPSFVDAPNMKPYSISGSNPQGTSWSVPELVLQANTIAERVGSCVILLDDFHETDRTTMKIMYEFLLQRKLGDIKLHNSVAIITAMNRSEESNGGTMSSAIKDRLSMVHVEFDYEYWYSNFGKFLHHYASSFVKTNPSYVMEAESVTLESSASPRAWDYFSESLALYNKEFICANSKLLAEQFISTDAANEFSKHILYMEAIDFGSVVAKKTMQDVSKLKTLDQILWAYIINYAHTPEDAAYIIKLINYNTNESSKSFVGFIAAELFTKFQAAEAGVPISIAQQIVINKMLSLYDENDFNLTEAQIELLDKTNFTDQDTLMSTASAYIQ